MEYLRCSGEEGMEGFENKWKAWIEFKQTRRYAEVLGAEEGERQGETGDGKL